MFLVPMTRQSTELARSFDRLFDEGLFDRFFNPGRTELASAGQRSPALDVSETERAYTVKVDLPGVAKEDVKVAIDGRRVSIEAESTRTEEKKEGERVIYTERSTASYARSFTLPTEVDHVESGARLDNGVLTLTLPKRGTGKTTKLTVS